MIGEDAGFDARRFHRTEGGVVLVAQKCSTPSGRPHRCGSFRFVPRSSPAEDRRPRRRRQHRRTLARRGARTCACCCPASRHPSPAGVARRVARLNRRARWPHPRACCGGRLPARCVGRLRDRRPGWYRRTGTVGTPTPGSSPTPTTTCASALLGGPPPSSPGARHVLAARRAARHDWHAGLVPAWLQAAAMSGREPCRVACSRYTTWPTRACSCAPASARSGCRQFFSIHGVEFHGQLNFMKAGLYYAERVTTVSPSYAREIQAPEQGCGFAGLLQPPHEPRGHPQRGRCGGLDPGHGRPAARPPPAGRHGRQGRCRSALRRELGLAGKADTRCTAW